MEMPSVHQQENGQDVVLTYKWNTAQQKKWMNDSYTCAWLDVKKHDQWKKQSAKEINFFFKNNWL